MQPLKRTIPMLLASAVALTAAQAAHADPTPQSVTVAGSTLFQNFFANASGTNSAFPASTNDFIDVNSDGLYSFQDSGTWSVQQLAPIITFTSGGAAASYATSSGLILRTDQWNLVYRSIGSVNGLQELLNTQSALIANPFASTPLPQVAGVWVNGGTKVVTNGVAAFPASSTTNGIPTAITAAGTDIAVLDVTSKWGLQSAGTAAWNRKPTQAGYGTNAVVSAPNGTTGTWSNLLVSRTVIGDNTASSVTFNSNINTPDSKTLFDTPIAAVPINYVANPGTGLTQIKATDLQVLYVTGRMPNGENLAAETRSVGSGTRNAAMNSIGVDPSFGTGDNIGAEQTGATYRNLGGTFQPTNYSGTGDLENGVRNDRLGVGYVGSDTAANPSAPNGGGVGYGSLKIAFNVNNSSNDSNYITPTIDAMIHNNTSSGWLIGGTETMVTVGDPNANDWAGRTEGGYTLTTNPSMSNTQAALYIRNITESITAFSAHNATVSSDQFMPGQYMGDNFLLSSVRDYSQADTDGTTWVINSGFNSSLQNYELTTNYAHLQSVFNARTMTNLSGGAANNNAGTVPFRNNPGPVGYPDNATSGAYRFFNTSGTSPIYAFGGAALNARNKIAGDFNGDGVRDINDVAQMMAAVANPNAWAMANGPTDGSTTLVNTVAAVPEILGDFNGDGTFGDNGTTHNYDDIRYFADGLAIATSGPHAGKLDRKAGFTAVDNNWTVGTAGHPAGNFFNTTLKTGKPYAAGDSRGDINGSALGPIAGAGPTGADGIIDAKDLDYVIGQIKKSTGQISVMPVTVGTDTEGDWTSILSRANTNGLIDVRADLSADMTGDLKINKDDLDDLVQNVLGTRYGDINLDGKVDSGDLNLLLTNFGHTGTGWAQGNFLGTPTVDSGDLNLLLSNFGFVAGFGGGPGVAGSVAVPEPASLAIALLGAGSLLVRRRRTRGAR